MDCTHIVWTSQLSASGSSLHLTQRLLPHLPMTALSSSWSKRPRDLQRNAQRSVSGTHRVSGLALRLYSFTADVSNDRECTSVLALEH